MTACNEQPFEAWRRQEAGVYSHSQHGTIMRRHGNWIWQRPHDGVGWPTAITGFSSLREAREFANEDTEIEVRNA